MKDEYLKTFSNIVFSLKNQKILEETFLRFRTRMWGIFWRINARTKRCSYSCSKELL